MERLGSFVTVIKLENGILHYRVASASMPFSQSVTSTYLMSTPLSTFLYYTLAPGLKHSLRFF